MQGSLLSMHLEAFVPIEIAALQQQGGVTNWHIEEAQRRIQVLREPGVSEALFYVEYGQTRKTLRILVECLAVLAFTPGGINAYGCHFEAKRTARDFGGAMRHQKPPGVYGSPPMACACCEARERQGGCVRGFPCQCTWEWCEACYKCKLHCQCQQSRPAKPFKKPIATYGYPVSVSGIENVQSKNEAQKIADQAPGRIVDNDTGLGWPRKWRVVSAEVEEIDEWQGVVLADCVVADAT